MKWQQQKCKEDTIQRRKYFMQIIWFCTFNELKGKGRLGWTHHSSFAYFWRPWSKIHTPQMLSKFMLFAMHSLQKEPQGGTKISDWSVTLTCGRSGKVNSKIWRRITVSLTCRSRSWDDSALRHKYKGWMLPEVRHLTQRPKVTTCTNQWLKFFWASSLGAWLETPAWRQLSFWPKAVERAECIILSSYSAWNGTSNN